MRLHSYTAFPQRMTEPYERIWIQVFRFVLSFCWTERKSIKFAAIALLY